MSLFSPWYSYRLFWEYTGLTPADSIRRLRAHQERTGHVTTIAPELGFGSVDGFTRAFAREFGMRPGAYAAHPVPIARFVPYGAKFRVLRKEEAAMKRSNEKRVRKRVSASESVS